MKHIVGILGTSALMCVVLGAWVVADRVGQVAAAMGDATSSTRPVREDAVVGRFAGHGAWRRMGERNGAARPWHVHAVSREDGGLRAKLNVPGLTEMQQLTAEGHIDGRDAFGVLLNEKGEQIGTFEATLDDSGTGGSFVLGGGESGTWSLDAAPARALRRMMGVADAEADTTEAPLGEG